MMHKNTVENNLLVVLDGIAFHKIVMLQSRTRIKLLWVTFQER